MIHMRFIYHRTPKGQPSEMIYRSIPERHLFIPVPLYQSYPQTWACNIRGKHIHPRRSRQGHVHPSLEIAFSAYEARRASAKNPEQNARMSYQQVMRSRQTGDGKTEEEIELQSPQTLQKAIESFKAGRVNNLNKGILFCWH